MEMELENRKWKLWTDANGDERVNDGYTWRQMKGPDNKREFFHLEKNH